MRTIKFRGKGIDNGEWVYGNYIEKINPQIEEPTFWAALIHDRALTTVKVIPSTVGQFTGLTDKNGKEIYEGDILRWQCKLSRDRKYKEYKVIIEWSLFPLGYEIAILLNGEKYMPKSSNWNKENREVIGNIHDNPELL